MKVLHDIEMSSDVEMSDTRAILRSISAKVVTSDSSANDEKAERTRLRTAII